MHDKSGCYSTYPSRQYGSDSSKSHRRQAFHHRYQPLDLRRSSSEKRRFPMTDLLNGLKVPLNRRSFVKKGMIAAGAATMGAGLLPYSPSLFAKERPQVRSG